MTLDNSLQSFMRALLMHTSAHDVCKAAMKVLAKLSGIRCASIYLCEGDVVVMAARVGRKHMQQTIHFSECTALFTGRPMVHDRCFHGAPKNAFCTPIIGAARTQGLLTVSGNITKDAIEKVQVVAEQVGLSLACFQRHRRLEGEARTDQLTGLYNRRQFDSVLASVLSCAQRDQDPTSILFIDIDHFKRFNDAYGHEAGDEVLRQTAQLLQSRFQRHGIAARWGGEEFALILPRTGAATAFSLAENLRASFKQLPTARISQLSISIGVSEAPRCGLAARELIQAADEALYRAKESRDHTELAQSILVVGQSSVSDHKGDNRSN